MSETREPIYLELDWEEDFKLDAHVDSDGQQRFSVVGYIQKQRAGGLYKAPLIPELFFGENGEQLHTWSQYLTAGDHTILRRDSGNPSVPDHELTWLRVSGAPAPRPAAPVPRPVPQRTPTPTYVTLEFPTMTVVALVLIPLSLYAIYKLWWRK